MPQSGLTHVESMKRTPFLVSGKCSGPTQNLRGSARIVKRIKCIEPIDRTMGIGQNQKSTFSPNCIVRGPLAVLVYVPKAGEFNVFTKPEKFAWLKRLYVSHRN